MATITDARLTIAEAAARDGVSGHTLRYHERAGLVAPIERNDSGHRRFSAEDVERILAPSPPTACGSIAS